KLNAVEPGVDLGVASDRGGFDDSTTHDDHCGVGEGTEPVEWVGVEYDEVGGLADVDGPGDVVDPQQGGVGLCRGMQRLGSSESTVAGEIVEFPPRVVVRDMGQPRVGAHADGDAVRPG